MEIYTLADFLLKKKQQNGSEKLLQPAHEIEFSHGSPGDGMPPLHFPWGSSEEIINLHLLPT